MLNLILGILIGLLLAVIVMLSVRRYQVPIERTAKQVENKFKQHGEVYIEDEGVQDLEAYLESLPKE